MFLYFYATYVAAVLLNFSTSTPIPQITPTFVCPQGYQWVSVECKPITCPPTHCTPCAVGTASCQNVVNPIPVVTQPCPVGTPSCQTAVAPSPVVMQPCPVGTPSCQTPVAPSPLVTQPCPVATTPCQNIVPPIPVVTQPCPVGTPSCQTAVAPIPIVAQPCPVATASCQNVVNPIPTVTQPCLEGTTSCPTIVTSNPVPQPCSTAICPPSCNNPGTQCQKPCSTICPTPPPPPPPPPPTQPPPPPPPPPEPIIRCPPGSILLNNYCHLIYCGQGIYRNGKCIQTICPEGTVWTGSRCTIPIPQNQTTVYMTNVIHTKLNQSVVNHQINYTNNMDIYITESPIIIQTNTRPPTTKPILPSPPPTNCCIVITPKVCRRVGDRFSCTNQKVRQCGSICTNDYIYLQPPFQQPPPPAPPCVTNNCDYDHRTFYPDCSGCRNTIESEYCSSYCVRTICATRRCQSVELKGYCSSYPGSVGCRPVDGCSQDWCGY